ncbi:MAG: DUF3078 domain-containing protein [Lutibacter sp.]|nr:DUF3078 domain-containing protein [Lutibacter sp.]
MRFILRYFVVILFSFTSKAAILKDSLAIKPDSISNWKNTNNVKLIFTQNSFVNWNAGGNNSMSGILKIYLTKNLKNKHLVWENELKTNYGLNKEAERELRKTEDLFELNSTFGYRKNPNSNWYNSAKFNFKTQFTNGYNYPNTENPISKFFAPAYLFVGVGSEYYSKKVNLKLYLSPLTNKTTFVFNQTLANEGSFGVSPAIYDELGNLISEGENLKMEFGTLIIGEWETQVMENIKMANKLILYSDYLNNYGNIDVNWELNFDLTINKYVTANIGTHIIFDDDVKHKEDINNDGELDILGPKIQIKQLLGIGLNYTF